MSPAKNDLVIKRVPSEREKIGAKMKSHIKKSSSSNALSTGKIVEKRNGDGTAVVSPTSHKGFLNFMNNTFDDLKRKNRKSNMKGLSLKEDDEKVDSLSVVVSRKSSSDADNEDDEIEEELEDDFEEISVETPLREKFISQVEEPIMDNIKCPCESHRGRELINRTFNLSFDTIYKNFFTQSEFLVRYWKENKFRNVELTEWDDERRRKLQFELDLGTFGVAKNTEEQRMIEFKQNQCFVVESETNTQGVMYADYFSTISRICLTRVTATSTRFFATMIINYRKQPNFIAKSFIEKNSFNNMKECFISIEKSFDEMSECVASPVVMRNGPTKAFIPQSSSSKKKSLPSVSSAEKSLNESSISPRHSTRESVAFQRSIQAADDEPPLAFSAPPRHPSSVHIDFYLVNIFKWRVRQDTFLKFVLVLFLIIVAINVRLYVKLLYAENKMEILRQIGATDDRGVNNCAACEQDMLKSWRLLVTSSLDAIKNVERFLKDWERHLETSNSVKQ